MEGMGVKFTPGIGRHLLTPFKHVWAYGWYFWDPWLVQTVLMEGLVSPIYPICPMRQQSSRFLLLGISQKMKQFYYE